MGSANYYDRESFEQMYRCYPVSSLKKPHLENGDKILMPQSAIDRLASLHIEYPMLFEIYNPLANRTSHCGVLEFSADEGAVYLPSWMMQNLLLQEGDVVQMKSANLVKGLFVKLQPHKTEFLAISDPKAILESTLRMFSCLTTGDTIMIDYNDKKHYINIVETKPCSAVSIIETDCEVDFVAPLDYKEPEPEPVKASTSTDIVSRKQSSPQKAEPKFTPFSGQGKRLDGTPVAAASSTSNQSKGNTSATTSATRPHSSQAQPQPSRKLVFDSSSSKAPSGMKAASGEPPKEETKFKPFTGRKYSFLD